MIPFLALLACTGLALTARPAAAARTQETQLQDDNLLIYQSPGDVSRRLDEIRALGVDRVRVTVVWRLIAPDPTSERKPSNFDAANPDQYSDASWRRYDQLVRLAAAKGIAVNFNVSAPAPSWATGPTDRSDLEEVWSPSPTEFELFVRALGARYSGSYDPCARNGYCDPMGLPDGVPVTGPLPRVTFWSLMNEPNRAAWLAPQWAGGVQASARIYRALVGAGFRALQATGHVPGGDTVVIGDLAPNGNAGKSVTDGMKPLVFLRALYCVDTRLRPLRRDAARALGCPETGSRAAFAAANPALFRASGFGHHPYALLQAPSVLSRDRDFVQLADLNRLTALLDRLFRVYGQPRKRRLPVYLTEYGYQTNPPDPFGVAPSKQAAYINEGEFAAYRNRRVLSYAQFLLVDDGPQRQFPPSSPQYWGSFQTGLVGLDGKQKPAYRAFRLPIYVPDARDRRGRFRVWGDLRPAPNGTAQTARIEYRGGGGRFRTVRSVTVRNARGYLDTTVRVPASGQLRLSWNGQTSRAVRVIVG